MNHIKKHSGIALVAVLAILVVLALLAASFSVVIEQNLGSSALQKESVKLDMLQHSAVAHAEAVLTATDINKIDESLAKSNLISKKAFAPNATEKEKYGPWIYVKSENKQLIGRYRVLIEDEAAKVNLNKAFLTTNSKGKGWDTGEINLARALGVSKKTAQKIVDYKYGRDKLPGTRGDDDRNNAKLIVDGIDNNGDGVLDENDEGVNEPGEYTASNPLGDDIAFTSFREAVPLILNSEKVTNISDGKRNKIDRAISKRATIYSVDLPGSPTLPTDAPSDINAMTTKEAQRRMIEANKRNRFEGSSSARSQVAANLSDYRDENHVLSTVGGSTYGVEAICFNEVMANDDSANYWVRDGFATDGLIDDWVSPTYWHDQYGAIDNKRILASPSFAYSAALESKVLWKTISPSKTWLILDTGKKKYGKISGGGNSLSFTLPKGPGRFGSATKPIFEETNWGGDDSDKSYKDTYTALMNTMKKRGKLINGHSKFPDNFFKNQYAHFYSWGDSYIGKVKITSSTKNHSFKASGSDAQKIINHIRNSGTNLGVSFSAWTMGLTANLPEVSIYHMIRSRRGTGGRYYQVQVCRDPAGPWDTWKTDTLNVSGSPANKKYTLEDDKLWYYNDGEPMKTDSEGWLDIFLTSSPKVKPGASVFQSLSYLRMVAPEVVEMYNASSTPISLANWRVICNTGSLASEIGRIKQTAYYDSKLRKQIIDDNPVVRPRGHFYLVNDTKLFDAHYGNADFQWGSRADEQIPVFEMDKKNWGVAYKIEKIEGSGPFNYIYLAGLEDSDPELFQGETIRMFYPGKEDDKKSWNGALIPAFFWKEDQGKAFRIWNEYRGSLPESKGGNAMIIGLPARGGIVSLTLKNEYDQICARTVEYGSVESDEIEYSTEKEDPTNYSWVKRREPTIGGTENEALNKSMRSKKNNAAWVKNGPFSSVAELRRLRTGEEFVNLGNGGGQQSGLQKISSIADVLCSSHLRLEACDENAEITGWKTDIYTVSMHDGSVVQTTDADWEVNQWKGHTLRFLTGPLKGQKFPVFSNARNSVNLSPPNATSPPRSAPDRMSVLNCRGAKFTVGPGYHTPLCYTTKSNKAGTWLWRKAVPVPGTYDFYIYGLSDSIITTEFLEENLNADMDVFLWNYVRSDWDELKTRAKYNKNDCFNAGKIRPQNISPDGDVKLKLIAHDLSSSGLKKRERGNNKGSAKGYQSGYAWFNYAVITPMPVEGRVNFNTANARLLASLPGISKDLAQNIENGIDVNGKAGLKPYKNMVELLKVKGFTLNIFEKCANLIALNSSVYTVEVEAQTIKDINNDGKYEPGSDKLEALRKKRYIISIDPTANGAQKAKILEKY